MRLSRDLERQAAARQREIERRQRAFEREQSLWEKQRIATEKDRIRLHVDEKISEAAELSQEVADQTRVLTTILLTGLNENPHIELLSFRRDCNLPEFYETSWSLTMLLPLPDQFIPGPLGFFAALLPGAKRRQAIRVETAQKKFDDALAAHTASETQRKQAHLAHEEKCKNIRKEVDDYNKELEKLIEKISTGEPWAVSEYFSSFWSAHASRCISATPKATASRSSRRRHGMPPSPAASMSIMMLTTRHCARRR